MMLGGFDSTCETVHRPRVTNQSSEAKKNVSTLLLPFQATPSTRRKPVVDAPLPRPTIDSVRATIVSLGKASSAVKGSREYAFASDVARAGKDGDLDLFAARVYAYNNVCRLGVWHLRCVEDV